MTTTSEPRDHADREAVEGWSDFDDDDSFDADDPPPGQRPRGGSFLQDLADVLRGAGLAVTEVPGWEQRQRGGTGYQTARPFGIIIHHTASPASWDGERDVQYMVSQSDAKPLANLYLDRSGRFWVLAAGATNTNGKGGPWGAIPLDGANSRVVGIEAGNNGIGEPWPEVMQDAYVRGVAALADTYGIDTRNVIAHFEWAPTRKVDPAGPCRFGTVGGSRSWNMDAFRAAVDAARGRPDPTPTPSPTPAPSSATYVVQPGDTWWRIADRLLGDPGQNWPVLADANGGQDRVLQPGQVLKIPGGAAGPPCPGEARPEDRGPIVLAWQEALIAKGVIRDNASNRDAYYGPGMRAAVVRLQRSWGWDDADGVAGTRTWSQLYGG